MVPLFANGSPSKDMTLEQIKAALGTRGWKSASNLFRNRMAGEDKANWSTFSPDQKLKWFRQWVLNPTMARLSNCNKQESFTLEQTTD